MTREPHKVRLLQLIQERAVKKGVFELSSKKRSGYYIDAKLVTLHPEGAFLIAEIFLRMLPLDVLVLGGLELGAAPIVGAVTTLSHCYNVPVSGFIIRKEAKGHGINSQYEGVPLSGNAQVAIVEDVITTGGSALKAIEVVEALGADVRCVMSVVDREEGAREALAEKGIELLSIFTKDDLFIEGG